MSSQSEHIEPKAKGASAYNDPSWWYDIRGFFILMGTYQVTLFNHLSFFSKNIKNVHLEAAVGSGSFLYLTLATCKMKKIARPAELIGIDYAKRMLDGAKRLFNGKPNVTMLQADLTCIDYEDDYFESVNIAHSFHAFPEPDKVLKELNRVMKPNAKLYVDVLLHPRGGSFRQWLATKVNNFCFRKGILARTCDRDETLKQFTDAGFTLEENEINGNTLHVIARK